MTDVFTIQGAGVNRKADSKPQVFINDDLLPTNITNGDYTFENLGYGKNVVVNLKNGGIVTWVDYTDVASEISVPMSPDLYSLAYCSQLARGPSFQLKITDLECNVAAVVHSCNADQPTGVSLNSGTDMRLVFKGSPVEFILI